MTRPGPKKLAPSLKRKKIQVAVEQAVRDAIDVYASEHNMTTSAAARVLIIKGYRSLGYVAPELRQ
jgi:hypothetical protein